MNCNAKCRWLAKYLLAEENKDPLSFTWNCKYKRMHASDDTDGAKLKLVFRSDTVRQSAGLAAQCEGPRTQCHVGPKVLGEHQGKIQECWEATGTESLISPGLQNYILNHNEQKIEWRLHNGVFIITSSFP